MHELLEDVAGRYDYVIVDTPAMGKFADDLYLLRW